MVRITLKDMLNESGGKSILAQGSQGGLRVCTLGGDAGGMSVPLVLSLHFEQPAPEFFDSFRRCSLRTN